MSFSGKDTNYLDRSMTTAEIQCLWASHYAPLLIKSYPDIESDNLEPFVKPDVEKMKPKIELYTTAFLLAVCRLEALRAVSHDERLAEAVDEVYARFTADVLGEKVERLSYGIMRAFITRLQHKNEDGGTTPIVVIMAEILEDQAKLGHFSEVHNMQFLGKCLDMSNQFSERLTGLSR